VSAEEILDKAGQYLAEDPSHWIKDFLRNNEGGVCSIGAIDMVCTQGNFSREEEIAAQNALVQVVGEHYPDSIRILDVGVNIPSWNDAKERRYSEVVAMFEKARAFAAEKGL
jgi:hypothetical protein